MIRRVKGELVCECTDCGTEHAGGCEDDFQAFVAELREADWTINKEYGEWIHRCPECSEDNHA